jgi:hypothetical protein
MYVGNSDCEVRAAVNIICDLDGTIALDHKRNHHLHGKDCPKHKSADHSLLCNCQPEDRNWKSYFDACDTDDPTEAVIQLLHRMYADHGIYILSGRSMSAHIKTLKWLHDNEVPYNYLQLRGSDDRTDDHLLKLKWADEFGLIPENTLFVLEDRTRVVDAWRAKGFRCFQVADGNF